MGTTAKPQPPAIPRRRRTSARTTSLEASMHRQPEPGHLRKVVEHLHLRGSVVFQRMVPMQMVGRDVEQHGHVGREQLRRCRADTTTPRPRRRRYGRRPRRRCTCRRCCRRRQLAMPAARSRWFVRAVTVVLPLVPVTATHVLDSSDLAPGELDLADNLVADGSGRAVQVGELGDARACDAQLEMPAAGLGQAIDRALAELHDGAAAAGLARAGVGGIVGRARRTRPAGSRAARAAP